MFLSTKTFLRAKYYPRGTFIIRKNGQYKEKYSLSVISRAKRRDNEMSQGWFPELLHAWMVDFRLNSEKEWNFRIMEKFYGHVILHQKLTLLCHFEPTGPCLYKIIDKSLPDLVDGKNTSRRWNFSKRLIASESALKTSRRYWDSSKMVP